MARGRFVPVAGFVTAAFVLIGMAVAYACTSLPTLDLDSPSGLPGQTVTARGSAFGVGNEPVVFHWGSVDGPVLGQAQPGPGGQVSTSFTVPKAADGYHVVVATQGDGKGGRVFGTPARAAFEIVSPLGRSAEPVTERAAPSSSDGRSTAMVSLTIGLGAAGLALLATGCAFATGLLRRREVPVEARVD